MTFKQKIHVQYQQLVQDKIDVFHDMIAALTEDAKNDAKGSAGDKHETALSMMHLEQEKLNHKLREYLAQKAVIEKINPLSESTKICLGSLVQANGMLLFVAAALPKITVDEKTVIAVSPQSPLGNALLGKEVGFVFHINTSEYTVESIE